MSTYAYAWGRQTILADASGLVPNPAEATCIGGPNPVCAAGVVADAVTTVAAAVAVGGAVASNAADQQRLAEYLRAKNFCDMPPPPGSNDCATLSRQIVHAQACANLYEAGGTSTV
jgi:type VI secretion system secreted protein VgrG